jgi:hypothetical protein
MDVGDVPIPLPNVKASILGPVSTKNEFFVSKTSKIFYYRLLNFVIIIKMIQNPSQSMKMTMMIQIKISTNQNGRILVFFKIKINIISFTFSSDDISEWDQNFIKQFTVPEGTLFDIIMVSFYLFLQNQNSIL